MAWIKILGYRNRTHQQAGFQAGEQVGNFLNKSTNRQMANLPLQLMAKEPHLGIRILRLPFRKLSGNSCLDFLLSQTSVLVIYYFELLNFVLEGAAEEPAKCRFGADNGVAPPLVISSCKSFLKLLRC